MPKKYLFLIFLSLVGGFFLLRSRPEPRPQKIVLVPQHKLLSDTNNLIPSLELERLDSVPLVSNDYTKYTPNYSGTNTIHILYLTITGNNNNHFLPEKDIFEKLSCPKRMIFLYSFFSELDSYWSSLDFDEKIFYVINNFIHHLEKKYNYIPSKKLLVKALEQTLKDLEVYHKHFAYERLQKFTALLSTTWLSSVAHHDTYWKILHTHQTLICKNFCVDEDSFCYNFPNSAETLISCRCPMFYQQNPVDIKDQFLESVSLKIPRCASYEVISQALTTNTNCAAKEAAAKAFYHKAVKEKYAIYKYPIQYFMMAVFERNLHRILKSSENPFQDTLILRLQDIPRVVAIKESTMSIKARDSLKAVEDARSFLDGF